MKKIAIFIPAAVFVLAQTPASEKRAEFEVASIRPTATTDGSLTWDFLPGNRFHARNLTLKLLLRIAYSMQDYQIVGGPSWISSVGFDIEARAGAERELPRDQLLQMVRSLIADRFRLELHRENRQVPGYLLTISKNGPKLHESDSPDVPAKMITRKGQIVVRKMSMNNLASILTFDLGRPVIDQTGLKGDYAFTLEWASGLNEADSGASTKPSLFTAVQEQLGLKLESARVPVEMLVIDRVEKLAEN